VVSNGSLLVPERACAERRSRFNGRETWAIPGRPGDPRTGNCAETVAPSLTRKTVAALRRHIAVSPRHRVRRERAALRGSDRRRKREAAAETALRTAKKADKRTLKRPPQLRKL
jgi:hypothetical protein